ncbi:MAG: hypothetical protein U9N62_10395, partial [Thermotogota bacterium]|nr:hypothetical protein [Thermotogota bacterium]
MKKMLLLGLVLIGLFVLCSVPIMAETYDNLLVIYMPGGDYWAFTFGNSEPQVNWSIQGNASVS